ncbi:MAG: glycosyltransferase family 87 protein [Chthoniobacterales bacterium]
MTDRGVRPVLVALVIFLYTPFAYYHGVKLLPGGSVDFPTYHYAAEMVFLEGKSPYPPGAFDTASDQMGTLVVPYLYPPPSLLAFAPLALLSFSPGKTLMILASHVCYLWAIWLLLTRLTPLPTERRLRDLTIILSLVYLFLFDPAIVTLQLGQVNLIVLPFLFLALAGMRSNATAWKIALPLSIAILLKTYPALLLVPLLFRRQFKAIALTCAFFGVYTAIAALVLPLDVWSTWFQYVLPKGGYTNHEASAMLWNQNINAFVSRLLIGDPLAQAPLPFPSVAKPIATAFGLTVLGSTAYFAFRSARRDGQRTMSDTEIATFLLTIFLIAPLSWEHHLVYVLPAASVALCFLVERRTDWVPGVLIAAALCLIAWRVPFADESLRHGWWTLLISIKFYAALALWAFFLARLRREGTATPAHLPATR